MCSDDVASIKTAFKCINIEITLTEDGIQNYLKVLAIFFEYKRKLLEEWLPDGKVLDVW